MIVTQGIEHAPVLSNTGEVGEFTIRSSAKAFVVLSSGLYKNKIRAIIRELACNAVDSHRAAGNAHLPFEIHAPSALEPWFSIRDYGVGLSDTEVAHVYTVYFSSTKTDSNDYIGALGLGCKSPFSYTDNFTITAVKSGVKRIYGAFINENGVPSVTLMYEADTDEHPGVEIKLNVSKTDDYCSFAREMREVLRWFKDPYRLLNYNTDSYGEIGPRVMEERDLIPGVHLSGMRVSYAVMGNIAYPLNNVPNSSLLGDNAWLLDCGLVIEFDIGELDFVASREELSFIPLTYAAIRKRLDALGAQLEAIAKARVVPIDNQWLQANTAMQLGGIYRPTLKALIPTLGNPMLSVRYGDPYRAPIYVEDSYLESANLSLSVSYIAHSGRATHTRSGRHYDLTGGTGYRIDTNGSVIFVMNDTARGVHTKALAQLKLTRTYLTVVTVNYTGTDLSERQGAFTKFLEKFFNPPEVVYASIFIEKATNPARVGRPRTYPVYRRAGLSFMRCGGMRRSDWYFVEGDELAAGKHVYVDYANYTPKTTAGDEYHLEYTVFHLNRAGIVTPEVVGIGASRKAEIAGKPDWIHIDDYIARAMASLSDEDAEMVGLVKSDGFSDIMRDCRYLLAMVPKTSYLRTLLGPYTKYTGLITNSRYDSLAKLKLDKRSEAARDRFQNDLALLTTRYPLIRGLLTHFSEEDVLGYVNLVDQSMATQ